MNFSDVEAAAEIHGQHLRSGFEYQGNYNRHQATVR
jgi:hypothetical protein